MSDDTEKTNIHPVVELFTRRAKSNPGEMLEGRWKHIEDEILEYGNEADKAALREVTRELYLGELHENFMKDLLGVDESPTSGLVIRGVSSVGVIGGWSGTPASSTTSSTYPTLSSTTLPHSASPTLSGTTTSFNNKLRVDGDIEFTGRLKRISK
jgi:hypothetical protein